jgi:hypothetical protein
MVVKGLTISVLALLLCACALPIDKEITDSKKDAGSREMSNSTTDKISTFQLTLTNNDSATITSYIDITVSPLHGPTLTAVSENDNNTLVVSWNDVSADLYRVLFSDNQGNVFGPTTRSLSLSISPDMRKLGGSVVVEAYDGFGNSVFSAPIIVEAL